MKFMKIGTKPDTFYTDEATRFYRSSVCVYMSPEFCLENIAGYDRLNLIRYCRTVISDIPNDLLIRINSITYHLHSFSLLPKCGLLQRLCPDSDESELLTIDLNDIPGGAEAFELCAKFCYGITVNLSAHNLVSAYCASKFLRMTESVEKGNFLPKLEAFFHSCVLEGWKDSIVTLQSTAKLPEWSENLGITRKCIDSIVEKILTPVAKVSWSYTYTRPGYDKKQHQSVPKDWWTEDISDLDLDLFRCIITAVRSTFILPPQLIGEALHVYASRWLPYSTITEDESTMEKHRRVLTTIVNMIPTDKGSVSVGFLMRLISIANYVGASLTTNTDLTRKASVQLEEATLGDLVLSSKTQRYYDAELVTKVLESYLQLWKRQSPAPTENSELLRSIRKVGKLIDSYLQAVAQDVNMPVSRFVSLAEKVPDIARENHDRLYKSINLYLREHPDISKEEKKRLCRSLDCQKLSAEVRAHAVKNERLPLRTVVQLLYFDQESSSKGLLSQLDSQDLISRGKQTPSSEYSMMSKLHLGPDEKTGKNQVTGATSGEDKRATTKMKAEKAMERKGSGSEHGHQKTRDK